MNTQQPPTSMAEPAWESRAEPQRWQWGPDAARRLAQEWQELQPYLAPL